MLQSGCSRADEVRNRCVSVSLLAPDADGETNYPTSVKRSIRTSAAEEAEMLSAAEYMLDVALTGESLHVCFSSSNDQALK